MFERGIESVVRNLKVNIDIAYYSSAFAQPICSTASGCIWAGLDYAHFHLLALEGGEQV